MESIQFVFNKYIVTYALPKSVVSISEFYCLLLNVGAIPTSRLYTNCKSVKNLGNTKKPYQGALSIFVMTNSAVSYTWCLEHCINCTVNGVEMISKPT